MEPTCLQASIEDFARRKRRCLDFIDRVARLKQEFDAAFAGSSAEERLSSGKIALIRQKLSDAALRILVAGQFKAGKSTLLNAILGSELLPDDVAPCTAVITEIEYGNDRRALLYFKADINLENLPAGLNQDVEAHIRSGNGNPPPYEISLESSVDLAEYLTIPLGAEQMQGVRESPYAKCVLQWPLEICRGGAVLIDSPGLNEHAARDATTLGYINQADLILHVMSALQPCGMPDKKFIEDIKAHGQLPIIYAINRFDQLRTDAQREKIRHYILGLNTLAGPYGKDGIFFISAADAMEGRKTGDSAKFASSGMAELEAKISDIFASDRMNIKLGAINEIVGGLGAFTSQTLADINALLDTNFQTLKQEQSDTAVEFQRLDELLARIRKKVERIVDRYNKEMCFSLRDFFTEFCDARLEPVIYETPLPEIGIFQAKKDSQNCIDVLNAAVNEALSDDLKKWFFKAANKLEKDALNEIRDDIRDNLEEFGKTLARLRSSLALQHLDLGQGANLDLGDFTQDILVGAGIAGVGGAVGGVTLFVLERFLPALFGPIGWALMAALTLGSFLAYLNGADARDKLKIRYYEEADRELRARSAQFAEDLANAATLRFREEMVGLYTRLTEQIEDARRPLEVAARLQSASEEELNQKRKELESLAAQFLRLYEEGKTLTAAANFQAGATQICNMA